MFYDSIQEGLPLIIIKGCVNLVQSKSIEQKVLYKWEIGMKNKREIGKRVESYLKLYPNISKEKLRIITKDQLRYV